MTTTLISNLPNELIYEILKNLTFEQLYHKRTTNKLFWEAYKIYCKKFLYLFDTNGVITNCSNYLLKNTK
jgi:hypothetical protein